MVQYNLFLFCYNATLMSALMLLITRILDTTTDVLYVYISRLHQMNHSGQTERYNLIREKKRTFETHYKYFLFLCGTVGAVVHTVMK